MGWRNIVVWGLGGFADAGVWGAGFLGCGCVAGVILVCWVRCNCGFVVGFGWWFGMVWYFWFAMVGCIFWWFSLRGLDISSGLGFRGLVGLDWFSRFR